MALGPRPYLADYINEITGAERVEVNMAVRRASVPVPLIAQEGDSRPEYSSTAGRFASNGFAHWAQALSGQRVSMPQSLKFAIGGNQTGDVVGRLTSDIAAMKAVGASHIVILVGTNNTSATVPPLATIADYQTIQNAFLNAGISVIWIAELPRGDAVDGTFRLSATKVQQHLRLHRWLMDQQFVQGVYVVNVFPAIADPLSTTMDAKSTPRMLFDGLHQGQPGAKTIGQALADLFSTLFPPIDILPATNSDQYHATEFPTGCLNQNPMMGGTAGTTTAGGATISGTVADAWNVQAQNGTGLNIVCGIHTDATGARWQEIVVTGTPTVASPSIAIQGVVAGTKLAVGDVVESMGQIYMSGTGFLATALRTRLSQTGTYFADDGSTLGVTSTATGVTDPYTLILKTPRLTVQNETINFSGNRVAAILSLIQNQAVSATFRLRAGAMRKVGV